MSSRENLTTSERNAPFKELDQAAIQRLFVPFDSSIRVTGISKLTTGMCNTNYRVDTGSPDVSFVLRIYTSEATNCLKEQQLHTHMHRRVPVPAFHYCDTACSLTDTPYAILDFVQGTPLTTLSTPHPASSLAIAQQTGQYLAEIHRDTFTSAGFFDQNFNIISPIPPIHEWHQHFLDAIPTQRISADLRRNIQAFLNSNIPCLRDIDPHTCLVHADFRPDHLLIADERITAIIDWENALSCSPLLDLGLFFRHGSPFTPKAEAVFATSYEEHSERSLGKHWKKHAKLTDLAVMLQMLGSPLERPRLYEGYMPLIQATLQWLSPNESKL